MFIPIDAKADIVGSKKGKISPAQHSQLNAWCLSKKTGILDCLGRCAYDVQKTSLVSVNNKVTIVFKKGYLSICGRLVECEEGTEFELNTPVVDGSGYIIARYILTGSQENEFEIAQKTKAETLIQQDLNENVLGTYEFVLYEYDYNSTTSNITLKRTEPYILDIDGRFAQFKESLSSEGEPLNGYEIKNGTIEQRLKGLEDLKVSRFEYSSTPDGYFTVRENVIYRVHNMVFCKFFASASLNGTKIKLTIPEGFRPKVGTYTKMIPTTLYGSYYMSSPTYDVYIDNTGVIELTWSTSVAETNFNNFSLEFFYEGE